MIAPTERCPWRRRVLCGEVHDDNAYAMGGVAGHAGLFSCAARHRPHRRPTLRESLPRRRTTSCRRASCSEFWRRDDPIGSLDLGARLGHAVAQGLDRRHELSRNAVGHLGFTGTSIWIDLERDLHVIVLTNRVHPSRDNDAHPRVPAADP